MRKLVPKLQWAEGPKKFWMPTPAKKRRRLGGGGQIARPDAGQEMLEWTSHLTGTAKLWVSSKISAMTVHSKQDMMTAGRKAPSEPELLPEQRVDHGDNWRIQA